IAAECGLYAIVRPGPHINSELTFFGIPERVVWDSDCQARSPGGKPVILPMLPRSFPVPSYASNPFFAETRQWFEAALPALAPLCWPNGPIVMLQVDNEGAFYFRDGVYDQDYHPDAIAEYRQFLLGKYHEVGKLREAHGDAEASFPKLEPPKLLTAKHADELVPHLDWAEYQEHLLTASLKRMTDAMRDCGLTGLPVFHNLPPADLSTPLDPALLCQELEMIGADYYHTATPGQLRGIGYRTTELAARAEALGFPCYAAELGAGFPPFMAPLRLRDNAFSAMSALAYGLRAFNLYMAVDRDRWVGAPITPKGEARPEASFWRKLIEALERLDFWELERRVDVSLVVPRSFRRLARVLHAFGPISQAAFDVMGRGLTQCVAEAGVDRAGSAVVATQELLDQLWDHFNALGVSAGFIGGDLLEQALERSKWVIVASSGGLDDELVAQAISAYEAGQAISVAPFLPTRDASMRAAAHRLPGSERSDQPPWQLNLGTALGSNVARWVEALGIPRVGVDGPLQLTLHHDRGGAPKVAFVINPEVEAHSARCRIPGVERATDCLTSEVFAANSGEFSLSVPGRSVAMLELHVKA
ncbi:MAG: beta-galactosidase, partial [Myxococcales bacterium]|nr:beta-galactosidase [Myxococcales bacterium]